MSKAQNQRSQFIMMFFAFSFGMVLSNLLGQANQVEDDTSEDEVVMVYRGIDKSIGDLPENVAKEFLALTQKTQEQQKQMLYSVALEWRVWEQSQQQQVSIEEAAEQLFKLSEPTEAEVNEFYLMRADKINKPFFEVKEKIFQHLVSERVKKIREQTISEMIAKGDLALFLE